MSAAGFQKMRISQSTVTHVRLRLTQLLWTRKCSFSSSYRPSRASCASNNWISTRSLVMVRVSLIWRPYHNF